MQLPVLFSKFLFKPYFVNISSTFVVQVSAVLFSVSFVLIIYLVLF